MARIVFDLDGTLIDSAPDIHAAVAMMLAEEGVAPLDLATITRFIGNGLPHLVTLVLAEVGLPASCHAALTARVLAHYNALPADPSARFAGMAAALAELAAAGHALGLCTNKPEGPARAIVSALELGPFGVVIGGDSLPQRKPDPAPLEAALAALGGAERGAAIFVGDSEVDAETARRAGVPFLLFTGGYRQAAVADLPHHAAFDHHAALPGLVAELVAAQAAEAWS